MSDIMALLINQRKSTKDIVADWLREAIIKNQLPPGTPISEKELAKQLGVSVTPVREAIVEVAHDGLIERVSYQTPRVVSFTAEDIKEICQVREALEEKAVVLAVERITDRDIERLEGILDEIDSISRDNMEEFMRKSYSFHQTIHEIAGNPRLQSLIERLKNQIDVVRYRSPHNDREGHREILNQLRLRNQEGARRVMYKHLQLVCKLAIANLESRK